MAQPLLELSETPQNNLKSPDVAWPSHLLLRVSEDSGTSWMEEELPRGARGLGVGKVGCGRAASPFQAQDAAVGHRLLEHGQHVDLIHHHVQLVPGGVGPGGDGLVCSQVVSPPGWGSNDSEI